MFDCVVSILILRYDYVSLHDLYRCSSHLRSKISERIVYLRNYLGRKDTTFPSLMLEYHKFVLDDLDFVESLMYCSRYGLYTVISEVANTHLRVTPETKSRLPIYLLDSDTQKGNLLILSSLVSIVANEMTTYKYYRRTTIELLKCAGLFRSSFDNGGKSQAVQLLNYLSTQLTDILRSIDPHCNPLQFLTVIIYPDLLNKTSTDSRTVILA